MSCTWPGFRGAPGVGLTTLTQPPSLPVSEKDGALAQDSLPPRKASSVHSMRIAASSSEKVTAGCW